MATPIQVFSSNAVFAVWQPTNPWIAVFAPGGMVLLYYLWRRLLRSETVEGCAQPLFWVVGCAGLGVVATGIYLAVKEYSRSDPRASQDGLIALALGGMLAVAAGIFWVARTTEGNRIVKWLWISFRVTVICLVLSLIVLGALFGIPKHH